MIGVYLLLAKQNLVWPMITGKMQWKSKEAVPKLTFRPIWVGGLTATLVGLLFLWLFTWS